MPLLGRLTIGRFGGIFSNNKYGFAIWNNTNAKPMLKIVSCDPDRNIVASAEYPAAAGLGNVQ